MKVNIDLVLDPEDLSKIVLEHMNNVFMQEELEEFLSLLKKEYCLSCGKTTAWCKNACRA